MQHGSSMITIMNRNEYSWIECIQHEYAATSE